MMHEKPRKSSNATLIWSVAFALSASISVIAFTTFYMTAGRYERAALVSGWIAAVAMCATVVAFLILTNRGWEKEQK